jgi:hypothetical protein
MLAAPPVAAKKGRGICTEIPPKGYKPPCLYMFAAVGSSSGNNFLAKNPAAGIPNNHNTEGFAGPFHPISGGSFGFYGVSFPEYASSNAEAKSRHSHHEMHSASEVPRVNHMPSRAFLIAWLIVIGNHSRAAATTKQFNEIQLSNRSYIVCFRDPFFAPVFCPNIHQNSALAHASAQMEGAVN